MRALARPAASGAAAATAYLAVVVLTTPALEPAAAVSAALQLNHVVISGIGIGVGMQVYLSGRARMLGCRVAGSGGHHGGTAATSFLSFFSLVPLGCCGWWLYVLSLLPSVLGAGVSAVLIEHSQALAYLGLAVMFCFNGLTALKLYRRRSGIQSVQ